MPDTQHQNNDETRSRQRSPEQTASLEHELENQQKLQGSAPLARTLLGANSLASRPNLTVRASAIHQMQRTHGNRAIQRFMQGGSLPTQPSTDEDIAHLTEAKASSGSRLESDLKGQADHNLSLIHI